MEDANIITPLDASLSGEPWGRINYHPAKCADEKEHIHVVWQQDPIVVDLNDAVLLNGQLNRLARQAARERFPWDWGNRIAVKAHRRYLRQRRIILGNATSCTFPAKAFHQMGREGLGTVAYFAEGLGGDLDRLALALKRHQTAAAKAIGEVVTARARNLKYACQ
ncbi:hypothetical protein [Streptomyces europaeiscabiei]|uniref:hypothetical protein n=1 Tax=Streptomyces europaeiscabiei TaxID=146819 RepID=UPI002E2C9351|nr:hypothetical protein [Streptomyces europaeiscabiei]